MQIHLYARTASTAIPALDGVELCSLLYYEAKAPIVLREAGGLPSCGMTANDRDGHGNLIRRSQVTFVYEADCGFR